MLLFSIKTITRQSHFCFSDILFLTHSNMTTFYCMIIWFVYWTKVSVSSTTVRIEFNLIYSASNDTNVLENVLQIDNITISIMNKSEILRLVVSYQIHDNKPMHILNLCPIQYNTEYTIIIIYNSSCINLWRQHHRLWQLCLSEKDIFTLNNINWFNSTSIEIYHRYISQNSIHDQTSVKFARSFCNQTVVHFNL